MKTPNTIYHNATVTRERRNQLNKHKSCVIWFTGLSGSGKSTLAHSVEEELYKLDCRTFVLDGDNVWAIQKTNYHCERQRGIKSF